MPPPMKHRQPTAPSRRRIYNSHSRRCLSQCAFIQKKGLPNVLRQASSCGAQSIRTAVHAFSHGMDPIMLDGGATQKCSQTRASHSLPLNRRRRLRRAVEHNTVDLAAFVRDARRDRREHVVRHARPVGRHRVLGTHGTQHDRHAVRAFVTLHTHGVHVGEQHDRALPDVAIQTGLRQFLTGDRVGVAQNVESFLRDLADDADAEARAGNGWRQTISSGRPSSVPIARTSSLNSERSGSINSNLRSSGRPPTLWWDLMFEAPSPPPDSTTSG